MSSDLLQTPLHALHLELGAKMVPFAGYAMPVQYPSGILAEHRQTRASAGLFDVSHMGQIRLVGDDAAAALETLVPIDVLGLGVDRQRYALFTDEQGGVLDDLMVTRREGDIFLIVNAACKAQDLQWLQDRIGTRCRVEALPDRALLALQGPKAVDALSTLAPGVADLAFMQAGAFKLLGHDCYLSRSGYTGEDGFEISCPATGAAELARALLARPEVAPVGLGARDTLRLEAGLCLYGHELSPEITPVEAGLVWAMQKVRRPGGERAGGYPGAARIAQQLAQGPSRKRVGLLGQDRLPVREGAELQTPEGRRIGQVTSGSLGPSVNLPVAMAYVEAEQAAPGTLVHAIVRDKRVPMTVTAMPFSPHRYMRRT